MPEKAYPVNQLNISAKQRHLSKLTQIFKCYGDIDAKYFKKFYQLDCKNPFLETLSRLPMPDDVCDVFNGSVNGKALYSKISSDFKSFTNKINKNDIELMSKSCPACHHVQIINKQLYLVQQKSPSYETRSRSSKMLLKEVVDTFENIPDLEMFLDLLNLNELNGVKFNVPIFGLTKSTERLSQYFHSDGIILMPCFSFWSWPEPRLGRWRNKLETVPQIAEKIQFQERTNSVFWRGAPTGERQWFSMLSKKNQSILDIEFIQWSNVNIIMLNYAGSYKTIEEHCQYKYLLHQEGYSYSSRLKYLLLCRSVVIFAQFNGWEEYWYPLLEHKDNIVIFKDNGNETTFYNLLQYLFDNQKKAESIGKKGQELVQTYLNEQAVICYMRNLLIEYSKLFNYTPTVHSMAIKIDDFILSSNP
ncbi:unnamed protein product [Didymodactylos carnosus]|uniref:Glycosyl transferase CAP10 domain-containing protein n=1 Tax=Didymodactylos carnosus TaxID=1234261 RepID=A0A815P9M8_9BILA|nr:unnamed protein product [Didymodactylos carnosus]CAF1446156.1 unnamed protein product [Didymodactylos carnosus]CAF4138279.1 unnamed protein product [Didymodactylos carnosus]CAF4320742.1 unnamed protein product [Didymodactylos carnosus]